MAKKKNSNQEKKRQKKVMDKRRKDSERRAKGTATISENAARYQMMTAFGQSGKMDNFIRNLAHLSELFGENEDLKALRFDAEKVYASFDLAAERDYLARLYEAENPLYLPEEDGEFWKEKRKAVLSELIDDDFVKKTTQVFNKLTQTTRGFKKDSRAIQAGKLMLDVHLTSTSGADLWDNALWEIIFNTTLRDNPKALPEPVDEPAAEETPAEEEKTPAVNGEAAEVEPETDSAPAKKKTKAKKPATEK